MATDRTAPPPHIAQPACRCPLCGGPNGCSAAATGGFAQPCWCVNATFPAALLARLPEAARGRACICARCAQSAG